MERSIHGKANGDPGKPQLHDPGVSVRPGVSKHHIFVSMGLLLAYDTKISVQPMYVDRYLRIMGE